MPIDEQQKNTLVMNLSGLIRQSGIKVDVQRFSMALRALVEELEPGEAIELEGVYLHLTNDLAIAEKEALELCVVIASRSDKLGVPFVLPVKGQKLSPDAIEHIVAQYNKRTNPQPRKEEKADNTKRGTQGPAWMPDKRKQKPGMPQQKKLLIVAAVCGFAAVVFNSWHIGTLEDPIAPIAVVPPGGLPCTEIVTNGGGTAICNLPEAVFKAGPEETLKAKGLLTKKALRDQNVKELWVRINETRRIKMVF